MAGAATAAVGRRLSADTAPSTTGSTAANPVGTVAAGSDRMVTPTDPAALGASTLGGQYYGPGGRPDRSPARNDAAGSDGGRQHRHEPANGCHGLGTALPPRSVVTGETGVAAVRVTGAGLVWPLRLAGDSTRAPPPVA